MISDVPRPKPPHLNHERTRHGKWVWVVRVGKGPRIRIREEYDTDAFWTAYRKAVEGGAPAPKGKSSKGSLRWLIERYRDSGAWQNALSEATRRQRENIFKQVIETAGEEPAVDIDRKTIMAGVERRAHTPSQARHFLDAMRGMYEWALKAEHATVDPTIGVVPPPRPESDGFPPWEIEDVIAYREHWPLGTVQRVWLEVIMASGLRRGDAVVIGRQHVRKAKLDDGSEVEVAQLRTEKGRKKKIVVTFIVPPVLRQALDAGPTGEMTWICGERGAPMVKESFGNAFSEAARAAGIRKSAHGVRKISATMAANNGCTEAELEAMYGWVRGSRVSRFYTQNVDRAKLGITAALKLMGTPAERKSPAPAGAPPAPAKKASSDK